MSAKGQRRSSSASSTAALSQKNLTENDDVPAYIIDLCKTEESNDSDQQQQRRGARRVYGRALAQSFTADIVTKRSGHKVSRAMSDSQSDDNGKENQEYDLAENDLLPSRQSSNIALTITAMDKPVVATATTATTALPSTPRSALTPSRRRRKRSLEETGIPLVEPTSPSKIIEPSSSASTTTNLLSDLYNQHNNDDDDEDEEQAGGTINAYHVGASTSRFFITRGGSNLTSNNTMASLPPLERGEFTTLIQQYQSSHQAEMTQLQHLYRKQFKQWYFELRSGFSLLIYGYGSKRRLTHRFAREMLTDAPLIVVNGFSPIVSPKEIIEKITSVLPDAARSAGTLLDQARHITEYLADIRKKPVSTRTSSFKHIYLLIHNIECSGLQSERARAVLATLVKSPSIHCIATVDHIHSGFLWDSSSMAQFKWLAHDGTTFEPYLVETSYDNVLLTKSEEMDGKAARYVLTSLTVNARGLFRLLADYQLKLKGQKTKTNNRVTSTRPTGKGRPRKETTKHLNEETDHSGADNDDENDENDVTGQTMSFGLSYSRFYAMAKEAFLVSNDLTFRTQLTEFRDHRLMLTKRSPEGEDLFYIPFSEVTLTSLVQTIDSL
ncbi:origin recognition complex subunit 2-domain-containing protein [Syncephalis plumigaleata]|nr:origin recognition complex subunit 2-domain-containing protein [Syncephalis plumigaleata]